MATSDDTTSDDARPDGQGDDDADTRDATDLEFGPSGYLPPRASRRARKIVLRSPLGIQWVLAAVVAGVVVLVAGGIWLSRSGPPTDPFIEAVSIGQVDDARFLDEFDALVVTAGGPAIVFSDAGGLTFCATSGRVEGAGGVWSASTGRGFGVESLGRHPAVIHDGTLYVDPTQVIDGPTASRSSAAPGC